jgi:hypothetical protein
MRAVAAKRGPIVFVALGLIALGAALWSAWRLPRIDLARYAPESSLLYVQIDSLPAIAEGLTASDAWRRLAPALGLSSELDYVGPVADALGRLGLGSDEGVALGRAQVGVLVTALEAGTEPAEEGSDESASVVIRPRLAILLETHLAERTVRPIAQDRLPRVARRVYGEEATIEESQYGGATLTTARAPAGDRQMTWVVRGGLVVVGNHPDPVIAVLDTIGGRVPSLQRSFFLDRVRPAVAGDTAAVFAYVSQAGMARLIGVGPGVIAGSLTADADRATTVARLFGSISERAVQAMGYSGSFEGGRFTDRYFVLLTPPVSEALAREVHLSDSELLALSLVPEGPAEVTLIRLKQPGQTFDALLTALSANVNVGVSAALTQIAIELRRSYGVEANEPIAPLLGDEVAFLDLGSGGPVVAAFEARDQTRLLPVVERYLRKDGSRLSSETVGGTDILKSNHEDGRAAAFVGRFLVLGTRDQLTRVIGARSAASQSGAEALRAALAREPSAIIATQRDDRGPTADLFLAIANAMSASGAGPEVLQTPGASDALAHILPAVSLTRLRDGGLYTETRSAVGNLTYITWLL